MIQSKEVQELMKSKQGLVRLLEHPDFKKDKSHLNIFAQMLGYYKETLNPYEWSLVFKNLSSVGQLRNAGLCLLEISQKIAEELAKKSKPNWIEPRENIA